LLCRHLGRSARSFGKRGRPVAQSIECGAAFRVGSETLGGQGAGFDAHPRAAVAVPMTDPDRMAPIQNTASPAVIDGDPGLGCAALFRLETLGLSLHPDRQAGDTHSMGSAVAFRDSRRPTAIHARGEGCSSSTHLRKSPLPPRASKALNRAEATQKGTTKLQGFFRSTCGGRSPARHRCTPRA
jgi:hypothetical protein